MQKRVVCVRCQVVWRLGSEAELICYGSKMEIIVKNYMGRTILFYPESPDGPLDPSKVITLASDGKAYASVADKVVGNWGGIPILRPDFGDVIGLPDPQDGVLLLVTPIVRKSLQARESSGGRSAADLIIPVKALRREGVVYYLAFEGVAAQ